MVELLDKRLRWLRILSTWVVFALVVAGCRTSHRAGQPSPRRGDEIIVCGQFFHTGTSVVTWLDPGGYDAYRVERRFAPGGQADWKSSQNQNPQLTTPNRYGFRESPALTASELERVHTQGWDLPTLRRVVDQFVLHFDACGTSRRCFQVLHDERGLSVHFLLDVDGTLYQTLDLKERAWHATTANTRAIGIEIAAVGAVPLAQRHRLDAWYTNQPGGPPRLIFPDWIGPTGVRTPGFIGHPARPEPIIDGVQGEIWIQYDFTPQQYAALGRLTASLGRIFPAIRADFPRDEAGRVRTSKLAESELQEFRGVLGHWHVQTNKIDPGPAFDWERLGRAIRRAR